LENTKRKPIKPTKVIPKVSIAKQRFEEEIAQREAKLRAELNTRFKAEPAPLSSLMPKYNAIMSSKGNKSAELRQKATEERRIKATVSL
jgi:hypothetical protein